MFWLILILISIIFISFRTILFKKLLEKNGPLFILFTISIFTTLIMLFFKNRIILNMSLRIYLLIFLKSAIISISWLSIYQALKHLDISVVSPLRNLSLIFLVIFSYIFLREQASLINYIGIFLLIISGYLIEVSSFNKILEPLKFFNSKYFLLIIVSLIGTSFSAILDKYLLRFINFYTLIFFFYLFLSIIFFVFILTRSEFTELLTFFSNVKKIVLIFILAIFATLSDFFYLKAVAIPQTLIVLIIPLRRTASLLNILIGGKLFNEKNLLYKSFICLIMIFAIFLIIL